MVNKFRELLNERFGMFVHYGIYSEIAGKWNGESTEGLGEWVQRRAQLSVADYEKFAKEHFLPAPDFAKQLVSKAKAAGVRYIVLTSKHHDGFCLFKSAVDGYNSYDYFITHKNLASSSVALSASVALASAASLLTAPLSVLQFALSANPSPIR